MKIRVWMLLTVTLTLFWSDRLHADLIGHWTLDETSGSIANDSSGRGHHGTYSGSPDLSAPGIFGSAMETTDGFLEVDLGNDLPAGAAERSIALWVNFPQIQGDRKFLSYGVGTSGQAFTFTYETVNGNDGARFRHWGGNMFYAGLVAGEWTHLAIRVPAGATIVNNTEVFINGEISPGFRSGGSDQTLNTEATPFRVGRSIATQDAQGTTQIFSGVFDDVFFFNHALTEQEILQVMAGGAKELAGNPRPADASTDVPRDINLAWSPGEFAVTHDVYAGTVFDDVNDAERANPMGTLASQGLDANAFDPGRLAFDQTYYWRVDEVNGAPDFTIFKGDVWNFTIEPLALPITNIQATASSEFGVSVADNTIDGSGLVDDLHGIGAGDMWISTGTPASIEFAFDRAYKLDEMWIWNSNQVIESFVGFGAKDVVIEHSLDGENWTVLEGVSALAQAPGQAGYAANNMIDFGGVMAQHVRMTINTVQGFAPQASLSEVRFLYVPTFATGPNPVSGATDVAPDAALSWGRNGREADHHDVYLGTDASSLSLAGTVNENSFDTLASDLQLGQTYAWRVDEVNDAMDPSIWTGTVWNFTTADAIVIDDMENYADQEFLEIWATWVDGFDDPANGSLVGGAAGIPETDNVHGGSQSLPMDYGNGGAAQSEATRTFAAPMDWSIGGAQTLVLFFSGAPGNTGQFYLKVNGSKVVYDGDASAISSTYWTQWNIDLASVGANLQAVASLTLGVEGGSGVLLIDDILLYRVAPAVPEQLFLEAEAADILGASWRLTDDPTASGGRYIGSTEPDDGDDNTVVPGAEWFATFNFNVTGGDYRVWLRGQDGGGDSCWVRITTATSQTLENPDQVGTGWVKFNSMAIPDTPDGWAWDEVHSNDHNDEVVNWTLAPGAHILEIAKREDGTWLDAIVITDDVN